MTGDMPSGAFNLPEGAQRIVTGEIVRCGASLVTWLCHQSRSTVPRAMSAATTLYCATSHVTSHAPLIRVSLAQLFSRRPLYKYKMVLLDSNSAGETDHQPMIRPPPLPQDRWKNIVVPTLQCLTGMDEPSFVPPGVIFCLIDGGKDRRRIFLKDIPSGNATKKKRDPNKTKYKHISIHLVEKSVRLRRANRYSRRGAVKLTQTAHLAFNRKTRWPAGVPFENHVGTNLGDTMSGVSLEPPDQLATVPDLKKKIEWLGKARFVRAGGRVDVESSDSDSEEVECNADVDPQQLTGVPLSWHALPPKVVLDLCKAYNDKQNSSNTKPK